MICHESNKHLVEARNTALKHVKGDYVAFLDSDDVWDETKIEKQVAFLEANPDCGACFTWAEIIDEAGKPCSLKDPEIQTFYDMFHEKNRSHKDWFLRFLIQGNCLVISSALVRADIIRKIGPQNCSLLQLQDFEYWIRVLSCSKLHILEEELTKYRRVKDGKALSSWTDEVIRRDLNERQYVMARFFDYLADDLFISLFRDEFVCPDSCKETELLCEKAFLLKRANCGMNPFLERIQQLMSTEEGVRVLADRFDYTPKSFYRENAHYRHTGDYQREHKIEELTTIIKSVETSRSWQLTAPLRKLAEAIRAVRNKGICAKGISHLRKYGVRATWRKITYVLQEYGKYRHLKKKELYTEEELQSQRRRKFAQDLKISILVPLYNTPERFLREMIESVINQTYSNWELCMADGSDDVCTDVGRIVMEYAQRDKRICYQKLEENRGISGNTNACLEMATGDYISLLDHDDILHPAVLHDVVQQICEKRADFVYTDEISFRDSVQNCFNPNFKPDYAPDTLRSYNYICHFVTVKKSLMDTVGGFRPEYDGSQDYDMVLRLTEKAERIIHIPKILYYWRAHQGSVVDGIGAKPYAVDAAKRAICDHLHRVGLKGEVQESSASTTYRIAYEIAGKPLVSILIPNKDNCEDLQKCVASVKRSTYDNWEIIIIENNSTAKETFACYTRLQGDDRIRVVNWQGAFNYSAINNFGAGFARGDYILLLNNDVEVITRDWIEQMLMFAQRSDVGAVGAMLYYPDNTVQHAGVIVGLGGVAGHSHKYYRRGASGYMRRMTLAQNYTCVTAACLLMRRGVWDEIKGLDEGFAVAFNDVDMCMRIRRAGYLVVWTPYAELYHYESKSRGPEDSPEKQRRFRSEVERFRKRWKRELQAGDPYYNRNLTLEREDFSLR